MRDAVHRRRHRRHVGRRVRQRHAAARDTIRLVAAFDHRHVFIDPNPDPAVGVRRAQAAVRAAAARPGTTTTAALISAGGGVWPRTAKTHRRSRREARERARRSTAEALDARRADPARSCRRRSTCCGTAASARTSRPSPETHAEVGDRANDAVRVERRRAACPRRRRGRQPRVHPARPDRVRAGRRAHQHRLHRQLGRRRLLRPRGQLKILLGLAIARGELTLEGSGTRCSRRCATDVVRARALRQLPAGADPLAGGRALAAADRGATRI